MNGNEHFVYGVETVLEYAENLPRVEAEPVIHAHWDSEHRCSACGAEAISHDLDEETRAWYATRRCPDCGAHMDDYLELRTCYCPQCDKHFKVRSNDSSGDCPDCGHHVVLREVEE